MLAHHVFGDPTDRPVLFLHPGNATGASWGDLARALPGVCAICPDLPGFGQSRTTPLRSFAESADEVAAFLRAQRLGPLPVVGYSLGGYTGFALTLRHPDLVERACLTSFQVMPLRGGWWMVPFLNAISPIMTMGWARRRAFRSLGIPKGGAWEPGPTSPCNAATLRQIGRLAVRFDGREDLARIARPILALAGQDELPSIIDSVTLIAREAPHGRGAIGPGGHGWPATHPALFQEIVMSWLGHLPLPEALRPA